MSIYIPAITLAYPGEPILADWLHPDFDYGSHLHGSWYPGELDAFAPPPDMKVAEWSDQHRILQAGISRNPGPWRTDYTPYLGPIMDAYCLDSVRHLVFCAGTQLGKTETIYNIMGYIIAHDPYPTMHMSPREDDAKLVSRTRIQPMIEDCEILRERKPDKNTLFQTLEMHFPGMVLYLVGANSLAGMASKPCRTILRDEIDKYPDRLGDDADPLSKSEERAKSFWDIRKVIDVSSPTFEQKGILKQLEGCDLINVIHHPCPHCNELIRLYPTQIEWDDFDKEDPHRIAKAKRTARYICQRCGCRITNNERPKMIADFRFVAQQNITFGSKKEAENLPYEKVDFEPESIGFWVSSLSSPMLSWSDMCEIFMKAMKDRDESGSTTKLQNVVNDWYAEPWLESVKKTDIDLILSKKTERAPLIVPDWAYALTCGIDVQKWGFWQSVWAWSPGMKSAMIHYGFVETWDEIYKLCFDTTFAVENTDKRMAIWRAAMDIGGGKDSQYGEDWTKTEEIITWIRENGQGIVHPIKGMSVNNTGQKIKHSIMDKMPGQKGNLIPGGLVLWLLDTYQLKENLYWRFENGPLDPQPIELHGDTGRDFGLQLTAEQKQRAKNGAWEYVEIRKDNHLGDTSVYAHAAADFQWMGGVKILNSPQYIQAPAMQQRMRVQERGNAGGRESSIKEKLQRRRH